MALIRLARTFGYHDIEAFQATIRMDHLAEQLAYDYLTLTAAEPTQ